MTTEDRRLILQRAWRAVLRADKAVIRAGLLAFLARRKWDMVRSACPRLIIIAGMLLSYGCAAPPRRELMRYPTIPGFEVVRTSDHKEFDAHCPSSLESDLGIQTGRPAAGCFEPATRIMWIRWGYEAIALHELCHAAGFPDAFCADVMGVYPAPVVWPAPTKAEAKP